MQKTASDVGAQSAITSGAGVVVFFTLLSRVAGLIRDLVLSHMFGATAVTDAFFAAFTIPNTLRRFVAEGALTVAFIPIYTEARQKDGLERAKQFYASVFGGLLITLTVLVILGIVCAKGLVFAFASGFENTPGQMALAVSLTQWMFPYVFFISLAALAMGVLNAHNHFAAPAASQVLLNVAIIISAVYWTGYFHPPIYAIAVGVVLGGFLQIVEQLPALYNRGLLVWPSFKFRDCYIYELVRLLFPALFGVAVYQLNIIVLRQLGSYLPAGQLTYYYTADRLMQVALGVFAVSIATAALPTMSRQTVDGDTGTLVKTWNFSTRLTNLITVPAAIGLTVIALPIVSVLYLHGQYDLHDVRMTAYTTIAFAPGIISFAMSRTTVQAFYALKDMKTPVYIGVLIVIVNLLLGLLLMRYQVVGLAATLTTSSFIHTAILLVVLRRKVGLLGGRTLMLAFLHQTILSVVAVALAGAIGLLGHWPKGPTLSNILLLCVMLGVAMGVYAAGALWLRWDEAAAIREIFMRKQRRLLKK